ncbi:MAG TPA: nucleotidyltransferase domain-containing protein [Mycobacteriales bacterium]|nr:nucleotidyltransferase domain-containing protein [Mycobacteriales bacterium]
MDLSAPAASVVPSVRARVLSVLAGADTGLTGRRVAALAGASVAGGARILESLVSGGVVHRVDAGSASLYTLNRDHVGAPAVLALAGMRAELHRRMRELIAQFELPPLSAVLFGSAARGDGDEDSDIDLLLVRPIGVDEDDEIWVDDVERLSERVLSWSGNLLATIQYDLDELERRSMRGPAFLKRVETEGVVLHGAALSSVIRHAKASRR